MDRSRSAIGDIHPSLRHVDSWAETLQRLKDAERKSKCSWISSDYGWKLRMGLVASAQAVVGPMLQHAPRLFMAG
jgi:hypothetical protein